MGDAEAWPSRRLNGASTEPRFRMGDALYTIHSHRYLPHLSALQLKFLKLPFDEIFEGPLLKNGFILDDELNAASLRERVYTSDLINLVMGIELNGKKAVKAMKREPTPIANIQHLWPPR